MILETVEQAQVRSGQPIQAILPNLGLPRATYYRWQERAAEGRLVDREMVPRRRTIPPTPEEIGAVRGFVLDYPAAGYKRLTWMMVDEDVAYLRPYQVYRILVAQNWLFRRPAPATEALWSDYYNHARPHSALRYLRPVDYYRGDPEARLAERQRKLAQAVEARKAYWQEHSDVKERG